MPHTPCCISDHAGSMSTTTYRIWHTACCIPYTSSGGGSGGSGGSSSSSSSRRSRHTSCHRPHAAYPITHTPCPRPHIAYGTLHAAYHVQVPVLLIVG